MKYLYLSVTILLFTACIQTKNKKESMVETQHRTQHFCTREYRPVCAKVEIQCVTTPCEAVEKTFPTKCVMSNNPHAIFLHEGVCKKK